MESFTRSQVRLFVFGAAIAASLFIFCGNKALAFSGSGSGINGDPYQITTCQQLQSIDSDLTAYYQLNNNIDCNGVTFSPIGLGTVGFTGNFDGQNHTISKISIDLPSTNKVGLFSILAGSGEVKNLNIGGQNEITGDQRVGMIAGEMDDSSIISSVASAALINGNENVGGLVGNMNENSSISLSSAGGEIIGGTGETFGGLVGWANGGGTINITNAYFNGVVLTDDSRGYVGGLIGFGLNTNLRFAYSAGQLRGGHLVGGIAGGFASSTIQDTFTAMEQFGSGGDKGPVIGQIGGITESNNYFDANLTGFSSDPNDSNNTAVTNSSDFYDSSNVVFDNWTFDGTHWRTNFNDYPSFAPKEDPYMVCLEPTSTKTTIHGKCLVLPLGWGTATWEVRWSVHGKNHWHIVDLDDVRFPETTVSGLTPGTKYDLEFRFTNDFGTGHWGKMIILTTGTAPAPKTHHHSSSSSSSSESNVTEASANAESQSTEDFLDSSSAPTTSTTSNTPAVSTLKENQQAANGMLSGTGIGQAVTGSGPPNKNSHNMVIGGTFLLLAVGSGFAYYVAIKK